MGLFINIRQNHSMDCETLGIQQTMRFEAELQNLKDSLDRNKRQWCVQGNGLSANGKY